MTPETIQTILASHQLWLIGKPDGSRADLRGAYLLGADLTREEAEAY